MTDWLLDMILEALLLWMLVAAQLCKKDGTIIIIIILKILHEFLSNGCEANAGKTFQLVT